MNVAGDGVLLVVAALALGAVATWMLRIFAGADRAPPAYAPIGLCVAMAIWTLLATPPGWVQAASLGLGWVLVVLALVDVAVLRLPDALTLPLAGAGLAVCLTLKGEHLADHAAGAVAGYVVLAAVEWGYRRLRGRAGLGLGDAKLAAAAGAWLGWRPLPSVLLIACAFGLVWAAGRTLLRRGASLRDPLPFGAPLSLATWIVWLYGPLELGG